MKNKQVVALVIPLIFFIIGGVGKILIRNSGGLIDRKDWYLAVDVALANIAAGIMQIVDTLNQNGVESIAAIKILPSVLYSVMAVFVYVMTLSVHQKWEHLTINPDKYQRYGLVMGANFLSLGMMYFYIIIIKGD